MKNNQKSILLIALLATIISACNAGSGKAASSQQTSGTPQESAPVKIKTNDTVNSVAYTESDLKKLVGAAIYNATSIIGINNIRSVTAPYLLCTISGGTNQLPGCINSTSVNRNQNGDIVVPLSTISDINNNIYQTVINGQPMSGWYSNYSLTTTSGKENYNMDYNLNPTGQDLSNSSPYVEINNDMESSINPLFVGTSVLNNSSNTPQTLTTSSFSKATNDTYTTSTTTAWNFTYGEKLTLQAKIPLLTAGLEVSWSIGVNTSNTTSNSNSVTTTYTASPQNIVVPANSTATVQVYLNVANVTGTYTTYTPVPNIIQFDSTATCDGCSSIDSSASHSLYVSLPAAYESAPTDFSFLGTPNESAAQGVYVKGVGNYTSQNGTDFIVQVTVESNPIFTSNTAKSLNASLGNSNKNTYSYHVKALPVSTKI